MKHTAFNKIKKGDSVTLAVAIRAYQGCKTPIRQAGEIGIVGSANVPAVTGRERNFHCVDFPNGDRVGAFREDLI